MKFVINPWDPEWKQRSLPRDPVSTSVAAIASFFTATGSAAVGVAASVFTFATASTLGSLLVGTALAAGATFLQSRASSKTLSAGINSNEMRLSTRQEIPPVRRIYGEALTGGAMFFEECKPPFLYRGLLFSEGPIDSLMGIQNGQTRIGVEFSPPFSVLTPPYSGGNLFISFSKGTPDQTIDPILAADFTNLDSSFRQRGVATLVYKANYGTGNETQAWEHFQEMWGQGGQPNILAKVRGVPVYDPRDPSQVRPPAREDYPDEASYYAAYDAAQATWKWTNNATLIITDYLTYRNGCRISPKRIDWEKTKKSADWDDGLIGVNTYQSISSIEASGTSTSTDGNTFIDRDARLPNAARVLNLGTFSNTPYTGSLKILKRVSAATYDVVHTQTIVHLGQGWQDFSAGFSVPNSGDFYVGVWTPSGITNDTTASTVARAFMVGEAEGMGLTFTENTGQALPVRARVANPGVLIKRHTIDGVVTAGQEPFGIISSMLTANRGILCRSSGMTWVQTGPQKPVCTLSDNYITGPISFRRSQPKKQLINRLRSRFIDPRQEWQTVDGPIIDRPDFRDEDGALYEASAEFAFTADHRRGQRLAHCHILESRLGKQFTTTVRLDWLAQAKAYDQPEAGRVVRVWSKHMPHANGTYMIMEMSLTPDLNNIELTLAEYDENIERAWNPATDEQDFELPDLDVS